MPNIDLQMTSEFELQKDMSYQQAKELLIKLGLWEQLKDYDGYSIVEVAVREREKLAISQSK